MFFKQLFLHLPKQMRGWPEHAEENIAAAAINDLTRAEMEAINKGGLSKLDGSQAPPSLRR